MIFLDGHYTVICFRGFKMTNIRVNIFISAYFAVTKGIYRIRRISASLKTRHSVFEMDVGVILLDLTDINLLNITKLTWDRVKIINITVGVKPWEELLYNVLRIRSSKIKDQQLHREDRCGWYWAIKQTTHFGVSASRRKNRYTVSKMIRANRNRVLLTRQEEDENKKQK